MHLMFLFGTPEVLIVLAIVALIIFGGSRLAGVGKGAGQAIREFKEETEGLNKSNKVEALPAQTGQQPVAQQQVFAPQSEAPQYQPAQQQYQQAPQPQQYQQAPQQPYAVQPSEQYRTTSDGSLAPNDERR